jgi:Fe-S cluster biogenesis protein NfuA
MFIQTEATPNPATIKFLPGQTVLESGTADFAAREDAVRAPLALRLFGLQGVTRVFLARDFVSVSKAGDTDWTMLKPMVLGVLMDHFSTGQRVLDEDYFPRDPKAVDPMESAIETQIKELLDTRVRPMVARDGGDIVFHSFTDGIVYLRMQGACSGCPSSTLTLKSGIENMLRHYVPQVLEVCSVEAD